MWVAYSEDQRYKNVDDRRQLFIDDDVVASLKNVTRRQHTPKKHRSNPLIRRDQPWEVNPYFRTSCFSVVHDDADGLFKCWYQDFYTYGTVAKDDYDLQSLRARVYYAESEDGLNWTKPPTGQFEIDGRDTNTVFGHPPYREVICPNVFLDERDPDPARRFKMVYLYHDETVKNAKRAYAGQMSGGLCLAESPDGIHWTPFAGNPIIPGWFSDVEILTWDAIDEKYVLWGRYGGMSGESDHPAMDNWFGPVWPSRPEGTWGVRRRIYRMESRDLIEWSDPELRWDPGPETNVDDGYYGFVPWREGEMHLGLLDVLHQVDNTMDMYLHHSRDGLNWNRFLDHRPFIPHGGPGSLDEFGVETTCRPIEVGDELWFFYGGMKVHHDWWVIGNSEGLDVPEAIDPTMGMDGHHLALATLRRDGYVSLGATVREGWVESKPVFSTRPHLYINGECSPNGYIRVEVMDTFNNVWDGFARDDCLPFTGDEVHHRVAWAGGDFVDEIPGGVKLRFWLKNAELYGFQFGDE